MNKNDKNISEIEIYNETYKIVNEISPEYTRSLAKHVDKKMKEISEKSSTVSSLKVAVLAALNLADELFKVKKELEMEKEIISKETSNLCHLIQTHSK